MNKPVCTPPQLNFWIICALFMIVAVSPQLDLAVSAFFFRDNRFYLGDWGFFPFLRRGLPEIFIGIAAAFGLIWGWGLLRRRWLWGINTKVMLLTTGSMLLGPILIVNGIFKTFWGRARPYQIIEFGGNKNFTSPMVISNQCDWDCSFMSGHTAVIFWSLALALLLPHRYRKWGISAVIILGIATGIARIAQGSHFVSDVFFSATITYALILWLHFKTFWGRARPYQIIEFGGNKNFTSPMVISNQCDWDCSFMSGHTAVIFWSLALALLLPHRYRKWGISAVIILGIATGIARIAQGSHFVSDVFFSATITYALILWLHFKLFPEQYCR